MLAPMRSDPEPLALAIAQTVAKSIPSPAGQRNLPHLLSGIAGMVAKCAGLSGVALVAFDGEGEPITFGSHGPLEFGSPPLLYLSKLREEIAPRLLPSTWVEVAPSLFGHEGTGQILALPLPCLPMPCGLLLITAPPLGQEGLVLEALGASADVVAAAVHSAIRTEAWGRIERLRRLAHETFEPEDPDLGGLVERLAELFAAGAVTLLLEDQGELRLAASTDHELGKGKPVVYRPGDGLTGHVFLTCRALRLRDTRDREETRRVIGIDRKAPCHPERDAKGDFTGQFLGVPMRFGNKVVGVLRMSRRDGWACFTREDEEALQFFGDLVGAGLAHWWQLLLARTILESKTEAIMVSRRELRTRRESVPRIVLMNPGAERLLQRKEMLGKDAREIYSAGAYEKVRPALRRAAREARERGRSEHDPVSSRLRRADGSAVSVTISYRIFANSLVQPATFYTIGLARDVSESEYQAEELKRFLDLLDTLGIAFFRADHEGRTLMSTPAESRITGYIPSELKGLSREYLYSQPKYRKHFLRKARANGGKLHRELLQMRRKDKTLFWAEGDLRILKDPEGHEIGVDGFYRDVTDRVQLQSFLDADTQRLLPEKELLDRLKADAEFHLDYVMSLGHQLQTPLSSLIENLRNFELGLLAESKLAERLPYVIGQATVCTRLVRNLSYLDKILRGETFRREKVSLARLAIETKLDFSHLLAEKQLELQVDGPSLDEHLQVQGHREMLRQVLVNLVDNAIKYSLPGSAIRIRGRRSAEGAAFEISNAGFPIPPEARERIFERGYRTRRAQALVPDGTGLGLWLVRKIVEAHGGSISCHEVEEDGQVRILFRILFSRSRGSRRPS